MRKRYIKYILILIVGLIVLSLIPEHMTSPIAYVSFFCICVYGYFQEKSYKFARDFENWAKTNENIRNFNFEHDLDREYCELYNRMKDPRINSETANNYVNQWRQVIKHREEIGLPTYCDEWKKIDAWYS